MSTAGPRYTPAELLALARRAEADGQLQYAVRLYSYLAVEENAPGEAFEARRALERLTPQPLTQPHVQPAHQPQPHPSTPAAHAPSSPHSVSPIPLAVDPTTGPPSAANSLAQPPPWASAAAHAPQRETTGPATDPPYRRPPDTLRPPQSEPSGWDLGRPTAAASPPARLSHDDDDDRTPLPRLVRPDAAEEIDEIIVSAIPSYRTGRLVAALLTLLGWLGLLLALALTAATFAGTARFLTAPDTTTGLPAGFLIAAGALSSAFAALLVGQLARAVFDIAASNRELTEIVRLRSGL